MYSLSECFSTGGSVLIGSQICFVVSLIFKKKISKHTFLLRKCLAFTLQDMQFIILITEASIFICAIYLWQNLTCGTIFSLFVFDMEKNVGTEGPPVENLWA